MLPNDNNDGNGHDNNDDNNDSSGWGARFCEHLISNIHFSHNDGKFPQGQLNSSSFLFFCFS